MANLRPVLFISLLFLGYLLWIEWQRDYGPRPQPAAVTGQAETEATDLLPPTAAPERDASAEPPGDLPSQPLEGPSPEPVQAPERSGGQSLVTVTTVVLEVGIDLVGGTVVSARLLDYPVTLEQPQEKVQLLRGEDDRLFIAQSGLLSRQGAPNHTTRYSAPRMDYQMSAGDSELRVPLSWVDSSGIAVTKTFVFQPGRYEIE
ncbi:MAG TPA: membrane protein insertase YidC, partial [Xanthomonadales bacterium]|nr:membrane protein insertase YidC [Xanthomonadales bacterium]